MAKLLSAVCTALFISIIATANNYTPASERLDNMHNDSFGHLFVIGLLLLLALYILIAIPLTMLLDSLIAPRYRTVTFGRILVTIIVYGLAFIVLGILFIAFSPMDLKTGMLRNSLWILVFAVVPFVAFEQLFRSIGRKLFRQ